MNPIRVEVDKLGCPPPRQYVVRVHGFGPTLNTDAMTRERAETMRDELESVLGVKALAMIKVVNYGLAGRGFEGEFTVGGKVLLSIPESQQAFFRATLVALRDAEQGTNTESMVKTPYEHLLEDDD